MFWYSVKDYKPACSGTYFVYQKSAGCTFVATCRDMNNGTFEFFKYNKFCISTNDYLVNITHFALIPPIPLIKEDE